MRISMTENDKRICLNCGATTSGKYCPECGQSLETKRFTMKSFGLHIISSITCLSGNFLHTSGALLIHPWNVVRDYVYGKRVRLVSPVSMLLLLAIYWGAMMAVISHLSQTEQTQAWNVDSTLKWLYGSLTFQYVFLAIPITLGTIIIYRNDLHNRFNCAEVLIATLYLASTFIIINVLLKPVELFNENLGNTLIISITGLYGIISIMKAFPQKTRFMTIFNLLAWVVVRGILLFFFLLLFALPLYKDAL